MAGQHIISRRHALAGIGAIALLPLSSRLAAQPSQTHTPRIDTLCSDQPWFDAAGAMRGGMDGAVIDLAIFPRDRPSALDALEQWRRGEASGEADYRIVRAAGDFAAARAAGKFGALLACQDAAILGSSTFSVSDDNLDNLRELHLRGLRLLQLTHNERNGIGDSFQEREDAGLSRLGHAVVDAMGQIGMMIDLSHCSDRTASQTIGQSVKPVAVTHAGCRALFPSARNKDDATIRALARKGGYFGVFMMTRWLVQEAARANVDAVIDHIDHAVRVGGIDCVGFASDQPVAGNPAPQAERTRNLQRYQERNRGVPGVDPLHGHESAADLERPDRMTVLDAALARRGYPAAAREKILGGNFIRFMRDVCG